MKTTVSDAILLVPENDMSEPDYTVLVPSLNEEVTISQFVRWCHEGFKTADVRGEILIVDSSANDLTSNLALVEGARVVKVPKRGLGRAYIDGLPFVRGKYLILGDCDCTYDFRHLKPFIQSFQTGSEYIMGSRFRGFIEPGAMPFLHRYFGIPITTCILNFIYGSHFSDIHCGMRGITRDAMQKLNLKSQGWEYASELVLKSIRMKLHITEVPISFYKDLAGRESHHKRMGWISPWLAGWDNLKAIFIFGPDFFLYKPGFVFLLFGLALMFPLISGPVTIGFLTFSLHWMMLGLLLSTLGLQCIFMGICSQLILDFTGEARKQWARVFSYNKSILLSIGIFFLGVIFEIPILKSYISLNYSLQSGTPHIETYLSLAGLLFIIFGFMIFTFTLVVQAFLFSYKTNNTN